MMKKTRKKQLYKRLAVCFLAFCALYFLLSAYLPPLFRKNYSGEVTALKSFAEEERAERAAVIDDNEEALFYRLRLIENAREGILLSSYSYYEDESGKDVTSLLYAAALRGVKVKIVVDGLYENSLKNFAAFRVLASHENTEVKIYNPISVFSFYRVNFRLHDKYLVCDDSAYILGGRNVGDKFLGEYEEEKKRNLDRDVLIDSSSAVKNRSIGEVKAYFQEVVNASDCKPFSIGKTEGKKYEEAIAAMQKRREALLARYPRLNAPLSAEETHVTRGVTLFRGETRARLKQPFVWKSLLAAAAGKDDVVLQTPYVICDNAMYEDLTNLSAHCNGVTVVTNSVRSGANPWGCSDLLNERKNILNTGAAVLEISSERSSHVKTMLAGRDLSFIGSFNLDMRSAYLNTETMLAIESEEINALLREQIKTYAAFGKTTAIKEGQTQFFYGENYEYRKTPMAKRLLYSALRIVILPVRRLL